MVTASSILLFVTVTYRSRLYHTRPFKAIRLQGHRRYLRLSHSFARPRALRIASFTVTLALAARAKKFGRPQFHVFGLDRSQTVGRHEDPREPTRKGVMGCT